MTELRDEHLEVIDKTAKAHEEQKEMRDELVAMNCTHFQMQELYAEMKADEEKCEG